MKKQILKKNATIAFISLVIGLLTISCDKKKESVHDHGSYTVTMTYTPIPAPKDSLISITFKVMEGSSPVAITNYKCEFVDGGLDVTMPLTEETSGTYKGQYIFTTVGDYSLKFKYLHDNTMMFETDTITVQ